MIVSGWHAHVDDEGNCTTSYYIAIFCREGRASQSTMISSQERLNFAYRTLPIAVLWRTRGSGSTQAGRGGGGSVNKRISRPDYSGKGFHVVLNHCPNGSRFPTSSHPHHRSFAFKSKTIDTTYRERGESSACMSSHAPTIAHPPRHACGWPTAEPPM